MIIAILEYITTYLDRINKALGFSLEFNYKFEDKGKFPIYIKDKDIIIVPEFFQHEKLSDEHRKMMITFVYSAVYLCSKQHPTVISPECLAKGICDALGEKYIPLYILEKALREIRISLYDDVKYASLFDVNDILRSDTWTRYGVVDIKKEHGKIYVSVESYSDTDKPKTQMKIFEESELYDLCMHSNDYTNSKVDLRKNLIILSAPSGTGKTTVYNLLKQRMPEIRKAVTVTTRTPRTGEINGEDYYFCSKEEFEKREKNGEFVEYNLYDNGYYATPFDEINKNPDTTPLFLIVDTNGMENIMRTYPFSTSIFLSPSSIVELEKRIRARGANTEDEIERRVTQAKCEMLRSKYYDNLIKNIDLNRCVEEIAQIVERVKEYV